MKNWQAAEKEFEGHFRSRGKKSFVHRLPDTKSVFGKAVITAQPSDYFVTDEGHTFYAEVKYCAGKTSFPFSSIQTGQWTAARRVTRAGGDYFFFIYSTAAGTWFRVPASTLINHERKSLRWTEISHLKWIC